MTQYSTGIVCSCACCGKRRPLLVTTDDPTPDREQFWPLVFDAMETMGACPQCHGKGWTATMRFVEAEAAS